MNTEDGVSRGRPKGIDTHDNILKFTLDARKIRTIEVVDILCPCLDLESETSCHMYKP